MRKVQKIRALERTGQLLTFLYSSGVSWTQGWKNEMSAKKKPHTAVRLGSYSLIRSLSFFL